MRGSVKWPRVIAPGRLDDLDPALKLAQAESGSDDGIYPTQVQGSRRRRVNGLPYYKAYPRDFIEGTVGMPFELKGAYRLVLDLIYMQSGRCPDDPRYVAGILGCSVRAWKNYRAALIERGKIVAENGVISNFRADKELVISGSFRQKQRENASHPHKNNDLTKPNGRHARDYTDTDTDKKKEKRTANAVPKVAEEVLLILSAAASEAAAASFIAYRRGHKSKGLTLTGAKRLATHLRAIFDAGGDPDDALALAEERGWASVEPDWYFRNKQGQAKNGHDAGATARRVAEIYRAGKRRMDSGPDTDATRALLPPR